MIKNVILLSAAAVSLISAQQKAVRLHGAASSSRGATDTFALLSAPAVGYAISNAAREVRVIHGVPGATHYSEPIPFPDGVQAAEPAPGHQWLLARRGETATAWIPERGVERAFARVTNAPDLVTFSPAGSAVAFFWAAERRLAVYAGLPDAAQLVAEATSQENWTALAVSDSGRMAAGMTESGELRVVLRDGASAQDDLIREARPVASFGYFAGESALVVASAGEQAVELIGSASRRLVPLPSPVSAQARFVQGGAGWFLLADSTSAVLHRIELDAASGEGRVRSVGLADAPMLGLQSLRTNGAVLLEAPEGVAPRIVLSHSTGEELSFLPTLTPPASPEAVTPEEEVQQQ